MLNQGWSDYTALYVVRMYNYDSSLRRKRIFYKMLNIFQHAGLCRTDNELKIKTVSSTFYKRAHKPGKSRSYNELFVWILLRGRRTDLRGLGFCSLVWEEGQKEKLNGGRKSFHSLQFQKYCNRNKNTVYHYLTV